MPGRKRLTVRTRETLEETEIVRIRIANNVGTRTTEYAFEHGRHARSQEDCLGPVPPDILDVLVSAEPPEGIESATNDEGTWAGDLLEAGG